MVRMQLPAPTLHSHFRSARPYQYTVQLRDNFTPFNFLLRLLFL